MRFMSRLLGCNGRSPPTDINTFWEGSKPWLLMLLKVILSHPSFLEGVGVFCVTCSPFKIATSILECTKDLVVLVNTW